MPGKSSMTSSMFMFLFYAKRKAYYPYFYTNVYIIQDLIQSRNSLKYNIFIIFQTFS